MSPVCPHPTAPCCEEPGMMLPDGPGLLPRPCPQGPVFQILGADGASFPASLTGGRKWPSPGPEGLWASVRKPEACHLNETRSFGEGAFPAPEGKAPGTRSSRSSRLARTRGPGGRGVERGGRAPAGLGPGGWLFFRKDLQGASSSPRSPPQRWPLQSCTCGPLGHVFVPPPQAPTAPLWLGWRTLRGCLRLHCCLVRVCAFLCQLCRSEVVGYRQIV